MLDKKAPIAGIEHKTLVVYSRDIMALPSVIQVRSQHPPPHTLRPAQSRAAFCHIKFEPSQIGPINKAFVSFFAIWPVRPCACASAESRDFAPPVNCGNCYRSHVAPPVRCWSGSATLQHRRPACSSSRVHFRYLRYAAAAFSSPHGQLSWLTTTLGWLAEIRLRRRPVPHV